MPLAFALQVVWNLSLESAGEELEVSPPPMWQSAHAVRFVQQPSKRRSKEREETARDRTAWARSRSAEQDVPLAGGQSDLRKRRTGP